MKDQLGCIFVLTLALAIMQVSATYISNNTAGEQILLPIEEMSDHSQHRMLTIVDLLMVNYSKQTSPHEDKPTLVGLGIYINSFYSISEQNMDFSVNIYLRQSWNDPRLAFDEFKAGGRKMIKLEDKMWERIWVPDVFFRNEKRANFHYVTIPNRLMRLYSDGNIWYAIKISCTLSCMMQLQKYPLDTQHCPMMLESFGHTKDTVIFHWLNESVTKETNLQMPQFILKDFAKKDCSQNYTTGAYSCLQVDFILERDFFFFLIQVYIPTILIVILSWVAFWINIEAIPARVSLGLLTVLTMTTQSSSARSSLPRVSYIKAIDVWLSVCLIFVFTSLLEFAVVNVYSRKDPKEKLRAKQKLLKMKAEQTAANSEEVHRLSIADLSTQELIELTDQLQRPLIASSKKNSYFTTIPLDEEEIVETALLESSLYGSRARKVDKISRRLFPLSFILFNVIYWVMYVIVK